GSANLKDIDELFRLGTKLDVRIAQPDMNLTEASCEKVNDPTYATVVGLLMRGSTQSQVVLPQQPKPYVAEPVSRPAQPATPAQPLQPKEEPKPAVQPAKPAEPVAPAQPATPVQPIETKPYVPPVVPASEVEDDEPEETEEESYLEPKEKKGFWGWVKKITEGFEAPGDEEI
ncbi:MAG: hypothetical protein IIU94_07170, partial [Alistipes sp.]|nr:hypothetical protein [Alistipes sp.]